MYGHDRSLQHRFLIDDILLTVACQSLRGDEWIIKDDSDISDQVAKLSEIAPKMDVFEAELTVFGDGGGCSIFIKYTEWTLAMALPYDSTMNIVLVVL